MTESKKVIRICGVTHTITEHDDNLATDSHLGLIDYVKCEICINKNLTEEAKRETLCHEVIHGILTHIGRNDLSADEAFVQSLGNAIYQSFDPIIEERRTYRVPEIITPEELKQAKCERREGYTPSALRNDCGDAQI